MGRLDERGSEMEYTRSSDFECSSDSQWDLTFTFTSTNSLLPYFVHSSVACSLVVRNAWGLYSPSRPISNVEESYNRNSHGHWLSHFRFSFLLALPVHAALIAWTYAYVEARIWAYSHFSSGYLSRAALSTLCQCSGHLAHERKDLVLGRGNC